ncbi:MAG: DUF3794 domain-containing protein [Defluviitaleaceae bacterium]|nr:DUF3794 domain-containing protein [Defluviitaleaceae bacterium]
MTNELVKQKLVLDQSVGTELTQILLEGDIIVPDIKPDMAIMLQADAKLAIERTEILADRVNFVGKLYIQVLYLARGEEKRVHSISLSSPVDDFINIDGIASDMWVDIKPDIATLDFRMINDRKINYKAIVEVSVKAETTQVFEVVVDIADLPSNQQLKNNLTLNKSVTNKADRFVIKDNIATPQGKANIREILQTNIEVGNQDVRVQNGKVNIFGDLLVTTLYKGENDENIIEFMEHEIPFNGNIEIAECREDMFADCIFSLSDQHVQIKPDEDGEDRLVEIEVAVSVNCKVSATISIEVLEDAHMINKQLDMARTLVKYNKLISRNKNQSTIKEVISLAENCPDILQIFRVKGKVSTDDVKILSDKVVVEGAIETDILYIAESDDTPLYSHKAMIPFRQIIEMKGATADMFVNLTASVDHVGFNMLSDREVELRFLISFNASVSKGMEASMVSDIVFNDMERYVLDSMPGIILYVVQNGDSLWKIAKDYNTSIDEISAINEIENPDKIFPGQKLLILKKAAME